MFNIIAIVCIILCTISHHKSLAEEILCGEWEAYKDEKCFKIYDETLVNYDEAIKTCTQQDNNGSLAIIGSKDEQEFIANLVFNTNKIADNVWIGIKNSSLKFTRVDNLDLSYTNWSPGSPQNESDYNCVQMIPEKSLVGKWINEPCNRKNAVLCEKIQVWSVARLQKILVEEKRLLREKINTMEQNTREIINLKSNPIPIGFIYVQLPGQNEPKLFWPTVKWEDVSLTYAGLFFRVLGGKSETFEAEQSENDRYLQSVRYEYKQNYTNPIDLPLTGEWSSWLFSGDVNNNERYSHQFKLSIGEIRPRNKAVKIWKRVA